MNSDVETARMFESPEVLRTPQLYAGHVRFDAYRATFSVNANVDLHPLRSNSLGESEALRADVHPTKPSSTSCQTSY